MSLRYHLSKTKIACVLFAAVALFCNPAFSADHTDGPFNSVDLLATTLGISGNEAEIGGLNIDNGLLGDQITINNGLISALPAGGDTTALEDDNVLLNAEINANQDLIDTLQGQLDFLNALSPEQVFALNRSLNNAVKSGLVIDYTSEANLALLQKIIDEDLDNRQIHFLTKALEQEARFLQIFARTGNPAFQDKANAARTKFLAKIDNTGTPSIDIDNLAAQEARQAARDAAKDARKEAIKAIKEQAKLASTDKGAGVRQAAQEVRELAKEAKQVGNSAAAHAAHKP